MESDPPGKKKGRILQSAVNGHHKEAAIEIQERTIDKVIVGGG